MEICAKLMTNVQVWIHVYTQIICLNNPFKLGTTDFKTWCQRFFCTLKNMYLKLFSNSPSGFRESILVRAWPPHRIHWLSVYLVSRSKVWWLRLSQSAFIISACHKLLLIWYERWMWYLYACTVIASSSNWECRSIGYKYEKLWSSG